MKMGIKWTKSDTLNAVLFIDIVILLYIELLKCYSDIATIINFIPDMLNLVAFVILLPDIRIKKRMSSMVLLVFGIWVLITALYPMGGMLDKYKRLRYIIIGIQAYYICIHYMTKECWKKLRKFLYVSQIIHTALVTYQHFLLHTRVDLTNGIFGFVEYNNAVHGLFALVMVIYGVEGILRKKMSVAKADSMIVMSAYTCALAEIKAFYVIGVIAVLICFLCEKKSIILLKKMVIVTIVCVLSIIIGYVILMKIMPENLYAFRNIDQWKFYEKYAAIQSGGMARTTQMQWIFKNVYAGSILRALIGKGLGSDTSFAAYELGKLFWNTGYIGVFLFITFLLLVSLEAYKVKEKNLENMLSLVMGIITIPCMVMWNATLNRISMLLFVILAIGSSDFNKAGK